MKRGSDTETSVNETMHTVTESDRQCARDLLAGFAHTQPPVEFMLEQCANHIAAHRERIEEAIRAVAKSNAAPLDDTQTIR